MAESGVGNRRDPYVAFRFKVEIEGIVSGGFTEVSGISAETEVETRGEGGVNDMVNTFLKGTKHSNLTLKRGMVDKELWDWYKAVIYGEGKRKNLSVLVLDEEGKEAGRWNFADALPVKWEGPALNASSSAVATESVVIIHKGLRQDSNPGGQKEKV